MNRPPMRLGILTGGGDAPGLNAAIRAVVCAGATDGIACVGLEDGFDGLQHPGRARPLSIDRVDGIQRDGGTILGTTNQGNPLVRPGTTEAEAASYVTACRAAMHALGLRGLIAIGGDGTMRIADALQRRGVPVIGVPKTIDNDVAETDVTIGFDSAVAFATSAIDRLRSTAEAHHRPMVVEVMGRYVGWIALHAGLAGGADVVLLPELPFSFEAIAERVAARARAGEGDTIIVAAEGARPAGGTRTVAVPAEAGGHEERLGGIAERVAAAVRRLTGQEARFDVLGHLQRGGMPTSADRVVAARLGAFAVALAARGEFGVMAAVRGADLVSVPLARVAGATKAVPQDGDVSRAAAQMGISFGTDVP